MTDYLHDFKPDIFRCDICEETFDTEYYTRHKHRDETICGYCLEEFFIVCGECGRITDKDDKVEVCPECGDVLKKE